MKRVVSVSRTYKHRGFHIHREKTKKVWHIYYYDDEFKFHSQQVDFITAMYYKLNKFHKMKFICMECAEVFDALVKNKKDYVDCPYCEL